LKQETLFISDLHLRPIRPATTQRFLNFLEHRAAGVESLYILGDLFDAWVGDDDPSPPNNAVKRSLKQLTNSGTAVYFQHGNRDFLIGERFIQETGIKLLGDYTLICLYGTQTLLTHGDLLCTDDIPYLEFRAKTRKPDWRQNVLAKPLILRLLYARWYRLRSYFHKRKKTQDIMDVNQKTVEKVMRDYNVTRLIHGHTHRPAVHEICINGVTAQRFVLDQWDQCGSVLRWNPDGYRMERIL